VVRSQIKRRRSGFLFSKRADSLGSSSKLRLQLLVLVVEAGEGLGVKDTVVTAVVDPGVVVDAHNVGSLIARFWESWEGKESSCYSVGWELMSGGTLEPNHSLGLFLAIRNIVRIVTNMLLG